MSRDKGQRTRDKAWRRWKAFASRAAQAQSAVVLSVLYYTLLVPLAYLRPRSRAEWRSAGRPPAWMPRSTKTADLPAARRQF